jgi:hypothetical protein
MILRSIRIALIFPVVLSFTATSAAENQAARDILARFEKGDPGWKARMEGLIGLVKIGPDVAPLLTQVLKNGSPSARAFAAQALVLFPDPATRPVLEQALEDPESSVRIHAIQALSMLGRLPRTERHEQILANDRSKYGVRAMMAAALDRDDRPDPAALRKALADYDLRTLDSARVGELAPDFTLADFTGKMHRLSDFRGKKTVVLRFILFDF